MSLNLPVGLLSVATLVRWLVGQFPYSGHATPPMFGDYEAQRHWMEITTNLPVAEWYTNTTNNDLNYWGIDYPPLSSYHMYLLGRVSRLFNESWTELHVSRGTESYEHKLFMRSTVIVTDLLLYLPAIIYFFNQIPPAYYNRPPLPNQRHNTILYTALVALYPAQILIDHGHFQYNCAFLGLVLWAIIFLMHAKQGTAAFLFTLALTYKQMALYYALPFFWFIASTNLRVRPLWKGLRNIILIGLIVLLTLGLVLTPFAHNSGLTGLAQVVSRVFPFNRGVFEDKVANLWFSASIFYKYRNLYPLESLIKASTLATLTLSLPAGLQLLYRPSLVSFKYALANTSLVFFLCSFQVHEKTILVPALPILLLIREHPMAINWFITISTFSLQPLLVKDGQLVPYMVLLTISTLLNLEFFRGHVNLSMVKKISLHNISVITYLTSLLATFLLSAGTILVQPPMRYPHLHATLNALFSCAHFVGFLIFFYSHQLAPGSRPAQASDIILTKKVK